MQQLLFLFRKARRDRIRIHRKTGYNPADFDCFAAAFEADRCILPVVGCFAVEVGCIVAAADIPAAGMNRYILRRFEVDTVAVDTLDRIAHFPALPVGIDFE